ncbi:MAG: hypothetical protein A3F78_12250 [Burkholderiales bacterium RIFCSPLOWO2_12_FULL_61_40]|nr:MAG: hypothetical protein A3F78_12250 [Burkholderiales bacterium RIFCSPLOWO2_12_FULL_61_40]
MNIEFKTNNASYCKWFKPTKVQFQLFYKLGVEQPDFVAETTHHLLMRETKAPNELGADDANPRPKQALCGAKMPQAMPTPQGPSLGSTC